MLDLATGSDAFRSVSYEDAMADALEIIDEEIEREAEHQFTRPITSTASFTVLDK